MTNKIYYITANELDCEREKLNSLKNIWIAELDGSQISNWIEYAHSIEKAMYFPTPCDKSFPAYSDWICDLSWLNADGYILIIKNYKDLMSKDLEKREIVLRSLENDVLPWWESDVERYVVEGKAKPFNVYLVD